MNDDDTSHRIQDQCRRKAYLNFANWKLNERALKITQQTINSEISSKEAVLIDLVLSVKR